MDAQALGWAAALSAPFCCSGLLAAGPGGAAVLAGWAMWPGTWLLAGLGAVAAAAWAVWRAVRPDPSAPRPA